MPDKVYCGEGLKSFYVAYRNVHGYTSLFVCIFGSIANLLNIVVLTRPEMRSPTNCILTGLAVADLLVMFIYIPFSCHMYLFKRSAKEKFTYSWAWFVLFHTNVAQVCHTVSIWLTVALAVWRCIAVAYPQKNRDWCGMQRTLLTILAGYVICPLLCIPVYLSYVILPEIPPLDDNGDTGGNATTNVTLYFVKLSELGESNSYIVFLIYSVVIKLIPCLALTILSLILIYALVDTKRRREMLISGSRKTARNAEKERQTDRTTRMLLAVLVLFLVTEFPQGILGLLSALLGQEFFITCYVKLGDLMDILALINSAINFMIYCMMSRQFRYTFGKMFRPRWLPLPQVENGLNNHNMTTTMVTQV